MERVGGRLPQNHGKEGSQVMPNIKLDYLLGMAQLRLYLDIQLMEQHALK
jgi:hypothetical protein